MLPHYPAVIEFVFNSRFAIGSQIQRRFPNWLRSERTAQYQLANLCRLGSLAMAPVRSTGPHFPYVYYATNRGVELVRKVYERLGVRRTLADPDDVKATGHAFDSILHELMLTEFGLALQCATDSKEDLELAYSERRFFRRDRQLKYVANGRSHKVIPDFGFLVRVKKPTIARLRGSGPVGLLHFLEWDNGTMSLARIREKYQQYQAWSESGQGTEQLVHMFRRHGLPPDSPNFRLLVVAHNKDRQGRDSERMVDLLGEAIELKAAMRDRIWLTTAEQLKGDSVSLNSPLWLRARDARAWLADHREQFETPPPLRGRRSSHDRRQHIFRRLSNMPRHSLFPQASAAIAPE